MTRKAMALVAGTLVLLAGNVARAGDSDPFMVGNRVRVALGAGQHRVIGRVLASDTETITLLTGDQPLKIQRVQITTVETSVGRRSSWLKGAAIGSVVGLAAGLAVPVDTTCYAEPCVQTRGQRVALSTFAFAAWGAGIGAFVKRDVWSPMELPRVEVGVAPVRRGAGVNVALRF